MARTPNPLPKSLTALTGPVAVVPLATREIPDEVKQFIHNALDESEKHSDYLRIPQEGEAPADVIDAAVKFGRPYAGSLGYKMLTREYKRTESTHLVYRVKPFEDDEDEDGDE